MMRGSKSFASNNSKSINGVFFTSRIDLRLQITSRTKKWPLRLGTEVIRGAGYCNLRRSRSGPTGLLLDMTYYMFTGYQAQVSQRLHNYYLVVYSKYLSTKFEGKTTLISSVTKNLLDENYNSNANHNILIAYFYVKHKQREKNTHNSLLRAIMEQIVARDPVLADHLFEELASVHGESLRSTKKLESLIATSLEAYRTSFIVVDGLDEAAPGEAAKSLNWLLSLVKGGLKEPKASLRVLFSGQRDGILDSVLSKFPSVALDSCPEHEKDIRMHCAHKSARIRQKFDISPKMEDEIISRVVSQANGK